LIRTISKSGQAIVYICLILTFVVIPTAGWVFPQSVNVSGTQGDQFNLELLIGANNNQTPQLEVSPAHDSTGKTSLPLGAVSIINADPPAGTLDVAKYRIEFNLTGVASGMYSGIFFYITGNNVTEIPLVIHVKDTPVLPILILLISAFSGVIWTVLSYQFYPRMRLRQKNKKIFEKYLNDPIKKNLREDNPFFAYLDHLFTEVWHYIESDQYDLANSRLNECYRVYIILYNKKDEWLKCFTEIEDRQKKIEKALKYPSLPPDYRLKLHKLKKEFIDALNDFERELLKEQKGDVIQPNDLWLSFHDKCDDVDAFYLSMARRFDEEYFKDLKTAKESHNNPKKENKVPFWNKIIDSIKSILIWPLNLIKSILMWLLNLIKSILKWLIQTLSAENSKNPDIDVQTNAKKTEKFLLEMDWKDDIKEILANWKIYGYYCIGFAIVVAILFIVGYLQLYQNNLVFGVNGIWDYSVLAAWGLGTTTASKVILEMVHSFIPKITGK